MTVSFEARASERSRNRTRLTDLQHFFELEKMKKIFFFILSLSFLSAIAFCADGNLLQQAHKSLKEEVFVAETDEGSISDSLNRISGNIDLGFTAPEQTYKSTEQYRPGPFGRQEQQNGY